MRSYFDHNATTPLDPSVLETILPYLQGEYGNASSIHSFGQKARAAVERARGELADLIHCAPREIVFTGGGTEADNLAILGAVRASRLPRKHVITSAIEHPAVLFACRALEREGVEVTYLPVDRRGVVSTDAVRRAIRPETVLITIMHANNEIGSIQPVKEIGAIAREARILFHTDAVQTAGKIPIDVQALGVDLLSLSAHKFYGPKGVGALFVRKDVTLRPIIFGGHDEWELRPGTENVAGIVGLGAAARLAGESLREEGSRLRALRHRLEIGILERVPNAGINGPRENGPGSNESDAANLRVPNTSSLYFDFIEAEALVIALDLQGIACSTGSACSSGAVEPSHVLTAMGLPPERARASIRLSLGKQNTDVDIDRLLDMLPAAVERLRALSPLTPLTVLSFPSSGHSSGRRN